MPSIKRYFKSTWWAFSATEQKSLLPRLLLFIVPTTISVGVFLSFIVFLPVIPSLVLGLAAFVVFFYIMIESDDDLDRFVDNYLSDEDIMDEAKFYTPDEGLIGDDISPRFYQGRGSWVAVGHIDPVHFLEILKILDNFIGTIDDSYLIPMIKHQYALNTYAPRTKRDAIKFVEEGTPNSYPVTTFAGSYDLYIREGAEYPNNFPVTPSPFLFDTRGEK